MKKVVNLRCPNCGSNLKINEDDKHAKCSHCESDLLIEKDMDDELKATIIENMKKNGKISRTVIIWFLVSSALISIIIFGAFICIGIFGTREAKTSDYNFPFMGDAGTKWGSTIGYTLDDVISTNKKHKDRKITVIYNDIKTTNEDDIIKIKHELGDFKYYELKIDYDKDGYVNKVTILDRD